MLVLPDELIAAIAAHCTYPDAARLSCICKTMYRTVWSQAKKMRFMQRVLFRYKHALGKSWGAIVAELLRDSPGEAMNYRQLVDLLGVVQAGPPMLRIREAQAKLFVSTGNIDGGVAYKGVSELYITTTSSHRVGYFPGGPPPEFMAEINY